MLAAAIVTVTQTWKPPERSQADRALCRQTHEGLLFSLREEGSVDTATT